MSLVTVRIEDADDPDADLPVSFQLMAAIPRAGDLLSMAGSPVKYEVVKVSWRLRDVQRLEDVNTEVDLFVRRVRDGHAHVWGPTGYQMEQDPPLWLEACRAPGCHAQRLTDERPS